MSEFHSTNRFNDELNMSCLSELKPHKNYNCQKFSFEFIEYVTGFVSITIMITTIRAAQDLSPLFHYQQGN